MSPNKKRIWLGATIFIALLFIPFCINRVMFGYSIAAGGTAMNLLESGTNEVLTKRLSPRIGYLCAFFYFFAVPFPAYVIANLMLLYFFGIEIRGQRVPFWKTTALVCFIAGVSFSIYSMAWNMRPIVNQTVGAMSLWMFIFIILSALIGLINLGIKLFHRPSEQSATAPSKPL